MADQLPGHDGDIPGAAVVLRIVEQAGAVGEVGVCQPQLPGPGVHPGDEELLRAAHVLGHGHGAVVGGDHGDALEHLMHAHLLARLQKDAAAAEGGGPAAGGHGVLRGEASGVQILHQQQKRHHLGDTGGRLARIGVLFVEDLACLLLHQNGGGRGDGQGGVPKGLLGRGPRRGEKQRKQQTKDNDSLHDSLRIRFCPMSMPAAAK